MTILLSSLQHQKWRPKIWGPSGDTIRVPPYKDPEVAQGCKTALRRLFPEHLRPAVRSEFMGFASTNDCGIDALEDKNNADNHKWWYFHGQKYQHLQPIAIKILSQVASSSSSKRNWSTYSSIHSIKHNQLNSKKADNLVFVHSNLRLTTHKENTYKKGEAKQWDVELEATELEVHFDALAIEDGDPETHCTNGSDPEATAETMVETADASGTNCASNQQRPNDDEVFDDFL